MNTVNLSKIQGIMRWLLLLALFLLGITPASAHYDPRTGRWLSRDPLGEEGGANLYAYCANDPVNKHDPLGLAVREGQTILDLTHFYKNIAFLKLRLAKARFSKNFLLDQRFLNAIERNHFPGRIHSLEREISELESSLAYAQQQISDFDCYDLDANGEIDGFEEDLYRHDSTSTNPSIEPVEILSGSIALRASIGKATRSTALAGFRTKSHGVAAANSIAPGAASIDEVLAFPATSEMPILEMQRNLALLVNRQGAVTDRFLRASNTPLARAYRHLRGKNPIANVIRGRVLDRRIHRKLTETFEGYNVRLDQAIPGSSSSLRPDIYFPNLGGKSVIFDIKGFSNINEIKKYNGMADIVIGLIPN